MGIDISIKLLERERERRTEERERERERARERERDGLQGLPHKDGSWTHMEFTELERQAFCQNSLPSDPHQSWSPPPILDPFLPLLGLQWQTTWCPLLRRPGFDIGRGREASPTLCIVLCTCFFSYYKSPVCCMCLFLSDKTRKRCGESHAENTSCLLVWFG
jgi:hypothetical protein